VPTNRGCPLRWLLLCSARRLHQRWEASESRKPVVWQAIFALLAIFTGALEAFSSLRQQGSGLKTSKTTVNIQETRSTVESWMPLNDYSVFYGEMDSYIRSRTLESLPGDIWHWNQLFEHICSIKPRWIPFGCKQWRGFSGVVWCRLSWISDDLEGRWCSSFVFTFLV
jgi:hypothetical protein